MKEISEEKIEKYLAITKKALDNIQKSANPLAEDFLDMAQRYYQDAVHYKGLGDYVTAFAAVNYAHGWIDSGVRAGILIAPEGTEEFIMPKE